MKMVGPTEGARKSIRKPTGGGAPEVTSYFSKGPQVTPLLREFFV